MFNLSNQNLLARKSTIMEMEPAKMTLQEKIEAAKKAKAAQKKVEAIQEEGNSTVNVFLLSQGSIRRGHPRSLDAR